MRGLQQEDRKEAERREKIIRVLPQAFLYDIEAEEVASSRIRIHFRPNPLFKPPSREAQICRGLEGRFWIDSENRVFVKAEGTLVQNVNFGWGFLASLHAGGHFSLQQTEIAPGIWRLTTIEVSLTGSKLLFKPINIRINQRASAFQRVSDHLTLASAVEMLRASVPANAIQ